MDKKDKMGYSIAFAFFIVMGIGAILFPSALESYAAAELSGGLKQMVAEYWGPKLGMAMIVLGALAMFGLHQSE